jgi:integrase
MGIPKLRRHCRGLAFVQIRGKRMYLGKFGSQEAQRRYAAIIDGLATGQVPLVVSRAPLIKDVMAAYFEYARQHYARDGGISPEFAHVKEALRPLYKLHALTPASQFGPRALVQVRTALAKSGLSRTTVNHHLGRIKRCLRWASENEVCEPELYHRISCVKGLYKGQDGVKEAPPVKPADIDAIHALVPFLSPQVGAMLQLQFYCGMRAGEVRLMRACDIDTSAPIWLYYPHKHKTEWRGHSQVKAIPKIAQEIIQQFMGPDREAYLFSPQDAAAWHAAELLKGRVPRKTPRYPSEARRVQRLSRNRARRVSKKVPGKCYSTQSYRQAIVRGFDRAEKAGVTITRFTPNMVRHSIVTFVSRELGQQKAQRWAGHLSLDTTQLYDERQLVELLEIAEQLDKRWTA